MRITKTEIKNHIEGKSPIATYYGGVAGLGLEIYDIDEREEIVHFVEVAGTKETPKKAKSPLTMTEDAVSVGDTGLSGSTNV